MKFKQSKKIIFLGSTIFLVILTMTLFSYGYLMTKTYGNSGGKKTSFKSQLLSIKFSDGSESLISSSEDYFIPGSTITKTFSIKNTGTVSSKFSINLSDVTNDFKRTQDLTYELKKEDEVISSGTFPNTDISLVTKLEINSNETQNFTLIINYLTSNENQIEDSGKIINANIVLDQNIKTFSKLKIYGNTIVDGTPSIETPSTIRSLGESSRNLFNPQKIASETTYPNYIYITEDGNWLRIHDGWIKTNFTADFKENTQYTFKVIAKRETTTAQVCFKAHYTDGTTSQLVSQALADNNEHTLIGTSLANKTLDYISTENFYSVFYLVKIDGTQLEEGSTATEYRPYKYIDVVSSGKNLFDAQKIANETTYPNSIYITEDGNWLRLHDGWIKTNFTADFKENTQYTFKVIAKAETTSIQLCFKVHYTDGTTSQIVSQALTDNNEHTLVGTSLANKTIDYISTENFYGAFYLVKICGTQLEEGTTATDYEPYQAPITTTIDLTGQMPLSKIGDVSDYIDLVNKTIVRKTKTKIFDGTEKLVEWESKATENTRGLYYDDQPTLGIYGNPGAINSSSTICTHFPHGTSSYIATDEIRCNLNALSSPPYISFRLPNNIASDYKTWFKSEYDKGTPEKVIFLLKPDNEKTIKIDNLFPLEFTNNITACDESMCSSNIEVEYDN